jgi:hypothetical protein
MDYNNLLWNKIEQSVKEKSANDLLDYAQKEYKELVENKLCEDFYTASEIVDFMRANDIPFSCRGRLPALVTSYLLNFITFNPLTFGLKAEYFFDSNMFINFDISQKRKGEIEDFLYQTFHNKVSKIALQDDKGKFLHACNYLFVEDVYNKYPPIKINGENCVFVSSLKWLKKQEDGFVIALLKMDVLDKIKEYEIKNDVSEKDYGLYDNEEVFERIRNKNNDYAYFSHYQRDKFNEQKENSIKALAYALMPEVDDKYLSHFICYARLIYKQACFVKEV